VALMAGTALVAGPVGRLADRSRRRAVMAAIGDPAHGAGRKITRFRSISMNSKSLSKPKKTTKPATQMSSPGQDFNANFCIENSPESTAEKEAAELAKVSKKTMQDAVQPLAV
jgi:hypothetical protein